AVLSPLGIVLGITAVVTAFFQNIRWRQVMQLLLIFTVLPVNSGLYTGLYLFAGIISFFNRKEYGCFDGWFLLLFILLLNPLRLVVEGNGIVLDFSTLASNISASAMLVFLTADSTIKTYRYIKRWLQSCFLSSNKS
ncbi:MAG: hypothetical protein LBL61_04260, partial [Elusimicrobiota bacterium]|nr:hypothetical protein [Elusimicrobiota bacterium]